MRPAGFYVQGRGLSGHGSAATIWTGGTPDAVAARRVADWGRRR